MKELRKMGKQVLSQATRMRKKYHKKGKECKEDCQVRKKKNCVKEDNKTCTEARLLQLILIQGEERAFLKEPPLLPKLIINLTYN